MSIKKLLGGIFFLFLSLTTIQSQIFVNASATGANTGVTWNDAFTDLQSAVNLAGYGAQIWVAEGTYFPTSTTDRNITFTIPNGVKIYGGFQGLTSETSITQRDWVSYPTILSGNIGISSDTTDNSYVIVTYPKTSITGLMDGLIIQEGYADGMFQTSGAAIFINAFNTNNNGSLEFENIIFQDNYSSSNGGSVYLEAGNGGSYSPKFTNCDFINNESGSSGGALYFSAYNGGNVTGVVEGCNFFNNYSFQSGGAMFNNGGVGGSCNPAVTRCNFEGNIAESGNGGAIYNLGTGMNGLCSPLISNCRFYNNKGFAAGAIYNNGSTEGNSSPTITNCTFVLNETTNTAGNGTIYNNGSFDGNSSTVISNSIIWGNMAPNNSQVLRNVYATPTISNCIVDVADCSTLHSGEFSTVTCGAGMQYDVNPLFIDEANGDLRLQEFSPAIDSGDNGLVSGITDLDNSNRIENSLVDLGAYERVSTALPIELLSFSGERREDKVALKWVTLSELDNDYFTLERSTDGENFQSIKKIDGAGNSNKELSYTAYDNSPNRGANYYRLKQTDFDGKYTHSNIIVINFDIIQANVYPNPVQDVLNVFIEKNESEKVIINVYDIFGNVLLEKYISTQNNRIEIAEVTSYPIGTYFIRVTVSDENSVTHKFQKM